MDFGGRGGREAWGLVVVFRLFLLGDDREEWRDRRVVCDFEAFPVDKGIATLGLVSLVWSGLVCSRPI